MFIHFVISSALWMAYGIDLHSLAVSSAQALFQWGSGATALGARAVS